MKTGLPLGSHGFDEGIRYGFARLVGILFYFFLLFFSIIRGVFLRRIRFSVPTV
jgi:hypothetical protein